MATLWLDLETFSDIPIKHGAHKYAEGAEVLLVALAVNAAASPVHTLATVVPVAE